MAAKDRSGLTAQIKENLWAIVRTLYDIHDYTALFDAANRLGIDKERARQAMKSGKGTEVLLGLILDYYGIQASEIKDNLPKLRKTIVKPEQLTATEELVEELRRRLSRDELIVELRTIIARDEIRTELGLKEGHANR